MISFDCVTIERGPRAVVTGLSLAAASGDLIAVIGPNGAGKSTLLAAAAGLLAPRHGQVLVHGEPMSARPPRQRARLVGYLPQAVEYAFGPSVLDVALLGRYAHGAGLGLASERDLALAHAALAQCEAEALASRRFAELSGGERQRVLLAQLLCQDAPLWLLDEPTSGLDPLHAHRLWTMLARQAAAGRAVLVATHDVSLARQFATRAWLVSAGEVRAGQIDEVLASNAAQSAFGVRFALATIDGHKIAVPTMPAESGS